MGFSCGIVGLPNVGKSTIFNALTSLHVPAEAFPFCTIEPNVGKVAVPDDRLRKLATLVNPQKVTPTTMEFVDIAGLVKGACKGEGLGNQFLGHIRNVDAIAHIVRCFEDPNVSHVAALVDPALDMEVLNLELNLADLDSVTNRLEKQKRLAKLGHKEIKAEVELLERLVPHLETGSPARTLPEITQNSSVKELNLLTAKPMMYVLNVSESDVEGQGPLAMQALAKARQEGISTVTLCGKLEAEIMALAPEEQLEFRAELGLLEQGLLKLIKQGYQLLGLITFYTTVGTELRAWTIPVGTPAVKAAGRIHTDMERGFIKAEVIHFPDYERVGSEAKAREAGTMKIEGKEYLVQDGDVIRFRFNV